MLGGGTMKVNPVHTLFLPPVHFKNPILRNPPITEMGANSQRNRKPGSFVLEELNRFHVKMVVVIMGNQNPINLWKFVQTDDRRLKAFNHEIDRGCRL